MNFIISALDHKQFEPLFEMSDSELESMDIKRMIVDENPGVPCRVSLQDAEIGEEVILLPYKFHKANSPYQASGPLFVRKGVQTIKLKPNEVPFMLIHRMLSFRGYDKDGIMLEAATEKGSKTANVIHKFFDNSKVEYIHIHNSGPGCYDCEVRRV